MCDVSNFLKNCRPKRTSASWICPACRFFLSALPGRDPAAFRRAPFCGGRFRLAELVPDVPGKENSAKLWLPGGQSEDRVGPEEREVGGGASR